MLTPIPYFSFCMSTCRRPGLLRRQIELLLKQSFTDFEVVISDNDPDCSAKGVVDSFKDERLRYFPNNEDLGMIKSYNQSILRSRARYVIMVTDDDRVDAAMGEVFFHVITSIPGHGIYVGCNRNGKTKDGIEVLDKENFIYQLLHPKRTEGLIWSSCVMDKRVLEITGGIPDYRGLHLADHAAMALCGKFNGGVIVNRLYSKWNSHDNNFSKSNIDNYYQGCIEFYNLISGKIPKYMYIKGDNALNKHLGRWFIVVMFGLRNYFTYQAKDKEMLDQLDHQCSKILQLGFMKHIKGRYRAKLMVFRIKKLYHKIAD